MPPQYVTLNVRQLPGRPLGQGATVRVECSGSVPVRLRLQGQLLQRWSQPCSQPALQSPHDALTVSKVSRKRSVDVATGSRAARPRVSGRDIGQRASTAVAATQRTAGALPRPAGRDAQGQGRGRKAGRHD